MERRTIRVERRIAFQEGPGYLPALETPFTISTEVDATADRFDIAKAAAALDRIVPFFKDLCDGCGVPPGVVHNPECPYVFSRNLIEELREQGPDA